MDNKNKSSNPSDVENNQHDVTELPKAPKLPKALTNDEKVAKALAEFEQMKADMLEMQKKQEEREKELDAREARLAPAVPSADMEAVRQTHTAKSQAVKEALEKQPKVRMIVPLEGGEKIGATIPVTINGYRLNVPKGVYTMIPEQVAQMLMESYNQTEEAGRPFRIDLKQDKSAQDALSK